MSSRATFRFEQRARGQALTEFLFVATFLLIPLFLLIPVIASLISLKQDVELAARYAVWERTVWNRDRPPGADDSDSVKSDAQIAREIDARIFAADSEPMASTVAAPHELDAFLYRAHDGVALLRNRANPEAVGLQIAEQRASESAPGGLAGLGSEAIGAFGNFTRFDLNDRGQFDATVSVDLADLTPLFGLAGVDLSALRLERRNRLLVEAWTGGAKRDVEKLISGLLPQQFMNNAAVRNIQDFAAFTPGAREIQSDWLEFGHVDIDPLPPYRLAGEAASP